MKRFLVWALCLCLLLSLTACGKKSDDPEPAPMKTTVLSLDKQYVLDDFAEFSVAKIHDTTKITSIMDGSFYYSVDGSDETYIDIILEWTNTGADSICVDDLLSLSAVGNSGNEYTKCFYAAENSSGTNLNQYSYLEPLVTTRVHCAVIVSKSESSVELSLQTQEQEFTYSYKLGTPVSTAAALAVNDVVEIPDYASLSFIGIEYTEDVRPTNTDGIYTHYSIDDPANTYLLVRFDITNLMSTARDCDSFVYATAQYMHKYTYSGFVVVEDEDGKGFSGYEDISPLSTRHFYYLIEVPKTVIENELTITIAFNRKEYTYTV